jgi:hypothetical protein
VVLASVYALRLFIRAMHNRVGPRVSSREIGVLDGAVLVPLVAVIVFLALYPQFALHRSEGSVKASVAAASRSASPGPPRVAGISRRSLARCDATDGALTCSPEVKVARR